MSKTEEEKLQETADDLGVFELGLMALFPDSLPPVWPHRFPQYIPPPDWDEGSQTPLQRPDLPRCSQRCKSQSQRQCTLPASYPDGMCSAHFRAKAGHSFYLGSPCPDCGAKQDVYNKGQKWDQCPGKLKRKEGDAQT